MAFEAALLMIRMALVLPLAAAVPHPPPIQPFSLADVGLAPGSEFATQRDKSFAYLLMLEPDSLLFQFRKNAGLPTPGYPYGGWEAEDSELRGHFMGHYLSATAAAALHMGLPQFRQRCDFLVAQLTQVQDALGGGYLSAFPESFFDRLEALQPVRAPFYTTHKVLAGLLDQHSMAGTAGALQAARGLSDYLCGRVRRVLAANGTQHWQRVLEVGSGGMSEALYMLYSLTAAQEHAECAHWFDKQAFFRPLVDGRDPLPGLAANPHLAQVQGFAAQYEQLGDEEALTATASFFGLLLQHHSFSTGGSSWLQHWGEEDSLGDAFSNPSAAAATQESCTTYNALKLARFMFSHTGDPALADYYERVLLNGVIGIQKMQQQPPSQWQPPPSQRQPQQQQQHHLQTLQQRAAEQALSRSGSDWSAGPGASTAGGEAEEGPGRFICFLPLGAGLTKGEGGTSCSRGWSMPFDSFWCCSSTAVQSFSRLADSVFLRSQMQGLPLLYVNQFVPSSLRWTELRLVARQQADLYPAADNSVKSRLILDIYPPDSSGISSHGWEADTSDEPGGGGGNWRASGGAASFPAAGGVAGQQRRLIINWRIPGWSKADQVQVTINGRNATKCMQGAASDAGGLGAKLGLGPHFGQGARFCALGPNWKSGDVVEAVLPMRAVAEPLNDVRPEMRELRAVMLGPFLMAGVTHDGSHTVEADPSRLEEALSIPDSTSFVSLRMAASGGGGGCSGSDHKRSTQPGEEVSAPAGLPAGALLRHCDGSVRFGGGCRGGSGAQLDATFKIVAPLAGCAGAGEGPAEASAAGCASAHLTARRRLLVQRPGEVAASSGLHQQQGEEVPWLVSFEVAAFPGHYLTVDQSNGTLALLPGHKSRGSSSSSSSSSGSGKCAARAQTFRLHLAGAAAAAVGGRCAAAFALEPLSRPGSRLQLASGGSQLQKAAAMLRDQWHCLSSCSLPPAPIRGVAGYCMAAPGTSCWYPSARSWRSLTPPTSASCNPRRMHQLRLEMPAFSGIA